MIWRLIICCRFLREEVSYSKKWSEFKGGRPWADQLWKRCRIFLRPVCGMMYCKQAEKSLMPFSGLIWVHGSSIFMVCQAKALFNHTSLFQSRAVYSILYLLSIFVGCFLLSEWSNIKLCKVQSSQWSLYHQLTATNHEINKFYGGCSVRKFDLLKYVINFIIFVTSYILRCFFLICRLAGVQQQL